MAGEASSIGERHPDYSEYLEDWTLMRDSYKGQRAVRNKKYTYLPATSTQIADGIAQVTQPGYLAYLAYLKRARFPGFTKEAVQMAIGMMHSQPPQIKLPKSMEGITSTKGETLHQLLRRINKEQLVMGRIGLLVDLPVKAPAGRDTPYLATYATERIINWDDGLVEGAVPQKLNLIVLDESENERDGGGFSWVRQEKYRVLQLGRLEDNDGDGTTYKFGVFDVEDGYSEAAMKIASYRGKSLDQIPFVVINAVDLVVEPDDPPLLDLANLCMTIYRGEADYRQNLFMQGQDTFVTIGANIDEDEPVKTGAGARIDLPANADAKYVGVTSDGLEEQRESLENDRKRAGSMGAQTLDTVSRERESGESLHVRMAARTADLKTVALTGAAGLQEALRVAARWMGEDPMSVTVEPNLEFGDNRLTGQSMVEMSAARNQGFPLSAKTLHQFAFDKGMTKLTFEEEMAEVKKEEGTVFARVMAGNGDVNEDQSNKGGGGDPEGDDK